MILDPEEEKLRLYPYEESSTHDIETARAMRGIASHYSAELDSKFKRLNNLVSHHEEIGRAHEFYVREFIQRFVPKTWSIASGFVFDTNKDLVRQQDVLIYRTDQLCPLLEVGGCIVVPPEIVAGTLEVKSRGLSRAELAADYAKLKAQREHFFHFAGMFVWDAMSVDAVLDGIWSSVRAQNHVVQAASSLPDLVYVRGKFLLYARCDWFQLKTPPLGILRLDGEKWGDGDALLGMLAILWRRAVGSWKRQSEIPAWLSHLEREIDGAAEKVWWPHDIEFARLAPLLKEPFIKHHEELVRGGERDRAEQLEGPLRHAGDLRWNGPRYGALDSVFPFETGVAWWGVRTSAGPPFVTSISLVDDPDRKPLRAPSNATTRQEALAQHILALLDCLRMEPPPL